MSGVTAILLAGSRPGIDPFAQAHGTDLKPLIPVAGRPMVLRPVETLLASPHIAQVRVMTQQPQRIAAVLPADPRLSVERSAKSIAATLANICLDAATEWPLLVTTADHALLDEAMIAEFCERATGSDLGIGLVERELIIRRLPGAQRTWIKFRGGAYSGANLFLLGSRNVVSAIELWRGVEDDRKSGRRLLSVLGPAVIFGTALRVLTLQQVARRVSRRLQIDARAIELSNPLAAVDVDKEADLQLVEAILGGRE